MGFGTEELDRLAEKDAAISRLRAELDEAQRWMRETALVAGIDGYAEMGPEDVFHAVTAQGERLSARLTAAEAELDEARAENESWQKIYSERDTADELRGDVERLEGRLAEAQAEVEQLKVPAREESKFCSAHQDPCHTCYHGLLVHIEKAEADRDYFRKCMRTADEDNRQLREGLTCAADAHNQAMRHCHCEACAEACDLLSESALTPVKELKERKKHQLEQGRRDAREGRPPAVAELAYIEGYEQGLSGTSTLPPVPKCNRCERLREGLQKLVNHYANFTSRSGGREGPQLKAVRALLDESEEG